MASVKTVLLLILVLFTTKSLKISSEKAFTNFKLTKVNSLLVTLLNIKTLVTQYGSSNRQNTSRNAGICGREDFTIHECTKYDIYYRCTCYTDCTCINMHGYCIAWGMIN